MLLDKKTTEGKLTVGRFDVAKGEAPPFHLHTREDEAFMLIKGTALVWFGEEEPELHEGGIVYLARSVPHGCRITSDRADLLMIATPGGIEGMFRHAGRDLTTPRPDGFDDRDDLIRSVVHSTVDTVLAAQEALLLEVDSLADIDRWFDAIVANGTRQDAVGGCAIGSLASRLSGRDDLARQAFVDAFARWEAPLIAGLRRM